MSTRAELKTFFETGDVPTEAQFADLIDSLLHSSGDTTDELAEGVINLYMQVAERAKLAGIAAGAEVNPELVSQAEAEAGVSTVERIWSSLRIAQAIAALGGGALTLDPVAKSSNFTAVVGTMHAVRTQTNAVYCTPPSSPSVGDKFGITDSRRAFLINDCIVKFNSASVRFCGDAGVTANIRLDQKDATWIFEYMSAAYGWVLVGGGGKIS